MKTQSLDRGELADLILFELIEGSHRVFLTGGAGTGKSTIVRNIIEVSTPILTSTTGVSAIQINGQTAHSFFKLGISSTIEELQSSDNDVMKRFRMHSINRYLSKMIKSIKNSDFIVIDEVSMLNTNVMDMILYRLEQAGFPNKPILFTGDLLQLPPVQGDSIMDSEEFKKATVFNLNKVYRTDNADFIDFGNDIRMGNVSEQALDYIKSKRFVDQSLQGYVQIYPTIREVEYYNNAMLDIIDNPSTVYKPKINKKGSKVTQREIDTFMSNARISDSLELKVGAQVIITRNSACEDYVNGDVATIEVLNAKSIIVRLERDDTLRKIGYIDFDNVEFKVVDGALERSTKWVAQALPIMLGWAITIHKSQGSGIDKLYIRTANLFAQSQFYVAISRSSNPDNLIIDYGDQVGLDRLTDIIPYINKEARLFYEGIPEENQYE